MDKFTVLNGLVAPLDRANVDTDQIIPKQYLASIKKTGFGEGLFADWRKKDPQFVLNQPRFKEATILLARKNFGCGSSREHAPWALHDYGFKAVIAPRFGDIFRNKCHQNGWLPVQLSEEQVREIMERAKAKEGMQVTVDLPHQTVTLDDGYSASFEIDPFRKNSLLEGLDDIGLTLQHEPAVAAFESHRESWLPSKR